MTDAALRRAKKRLAVEKHLSSRRADATMDGAGKNRGKGESLRQLARFAAGVDMRRLPAEIVDKAKACLLYAMGVGAAGLRLPQARQVAPAIAAMRRACSRTPDLGSCPASY